MGLTLKKVHNQDPALAIVHLREAAYQVRAGSRQAANQLFHRAGLEGQQRVASSVLDWVFIV
jgi:hypothetical protein